MRLANNRAAWVITMRVVVLFCLTLLMPGQSIAAESIRIVSQNMYRFFDNVDDGNNEKVLSDQAFSQKVQLSSSRIIELFDLPDIIAMQEVENRNVLSHLIDTISARTGTRYHAVIIEGNDISGIDVAYLIKPGIDVKSVKQLFKETLHSYDGNLLFSRPPLYLQLCQIDNCLVLLNLHLRSMRGIRSGNSSKRVRSKRLAQASAIARWVENFQQSNPSSSLMLLGDFNALTPTDPYVDVAGILRGQPDNAKVKMQGTDWINDDLTDLTRQIPLKRRYSFIYKGNKQIMDYMFTSSGFKPELEDIKFTWIDYKFSDHAGLAADFNW